MDCPYSRIRDPSSDKAVCAVLCVCDEVMNCSCSRVSLQSFISRNSKRTTTRGERLSLSFSRWIFVELSKSLRTRLSIFATSSEIRLEEEERKFEIREYIAFYGVVTRSRKIYEDTIPRSVNRNASSSKLLLISKRSSNFLPPHLPLSNSASIVEQRGPLIKPALFSTRHLT